MTQALWLTLATIAALPLIWTLASYFVRLPEQQRIAFLQFVKIAVQEVEQVHKGIYQGDDAAIKALNKRKKELAIASVAKHFKGYWLFPAPGRERIESAIESAVFELPPTRKQ